MKILILIGKLFFILQIFFYKTINIYLNVKYHSKAKKIGKGVRFNGISAIGNIEFMEIGDNVHVGDNARISAKGGLFIGDNTHISRNLVLYTDNHNYEGQCLPYDNTFIEKKVVIEKNVWIGMNVIILPGTYIEEGVIVGAGSVVSGRLKKGIIYGTPLAKPIKKRDLNHYLTLELHRKYGGKNGVILGENYA